MSQTSVISKKTVSIGSDADPKNANTSEHSENASEHSENASERSENASEGSDKSSDSTVRSDRSSLRSKSDLSDDDDEQSRASSTMSFRSRASISSERSRRYSWKSVTTELTANILNQYYHHEKEIAPVVHPLHELDNNTMIAKVHELHRNVRYLKTENAIFERFLAKNDPEALTMMEASLAQAKRANERMSVSSRRVSLFGKTSPKKGSVMSMTQVVMAAVARFAEKEPPKINVTTKSDLLMRETDEIQTRADEVRKRSHDIKFHLVSRIEEMETRKEELQRSIEEFEQFKQNYDQIPFDKFVRFMEEWSKKSRLMADKIRLRYSSLKVQYQKLSAVLVQKQLIGENLQEIDFEQLRIENLHLVDKIEKKTLLLIELKKMTGAGNLKLSQHKKLLQERIDRKESILETIKSIEKDISKSDDEIYKLYGELDEVKDNYYKIKEKVSNFAAPEIMEYVRTKETVDNLKKEIKMWSRRKVIKDASLNIEIGVMKKLLGCRHPHPSWFE
jgi:hypothetical protein